MRSSLVLVLGLTLVASRAFAGDVLTIHEEQEARRPTIARDDRGALHVAYVSYEKGATVPEIFHTESPDGGKSWEPRVDVSKTPGIPREPAIACGTGGHVVIVWLDTSSGLEKPHVFSSFSTDSGKSWSLAIDVSGTPGKSMDPSVAIAPDGTVHVVWADTSGGERGPEIWHALSTDKGASWSKARDISRALGDARCPEVACGPKNEVYVCWTDRLSERAMPEVFFSSSTDGGTTFSKLLDVSNTRGVSSEPDMAVDDFGTVYLVWADTGSRTGKWNIFFTLSHDGGKTWQAPSDVSLTGGRSSQPAISAREGFIVVVWRDTTAHEGSPNIWMALSRDAGKSFGEARNISSTPGVSKCPDVVISSGQAHVVWEEHERGLSLMKFVSVPLKSH
jgi:hypothetical protein